MEQFFQRRLKAIQTEISLVLAGGFDEQFNKIATLIAENKEINVFGLGAGRMGYSLQAFIMRLSHMNIQSYMIGDTTLPRIKKGDLVFINSSSGETKSIVLLAQIAKQHGAVLVAITTNHKSTIAAMSDITLQVNGIRSEQPMKTIYEQSSYLLLDCLAAYLIGYLKIDLNFMSQNHSILE